MAVKWLQSAVYPPAQPKLQLGLTPTEIEADYRRLQAVLALRRERERSYGQEATPGLGSQIQSD
jgi:hypothetical protein